MNDAMEYKDINPLFESKNIHLAGDPINDLKWVVIYPPTIDWDFMRQRPQQLMEQFSMNGYEVYFCNKTQSRVKLYTEINPNLKIIHNNSCFIRDIVPEIKKRGKRIILWVSWAKLQAFLDAYCPDFIVYDYLDDFEAWKPYLKPMVEKANIVVTTAQILNDQMAREFPNKPSIMVPNGCDIERFKLQETKIKPPELSHHDGPVILYSGAWAHWVDIDLVMSIAQTFQQALMCVIGAEFAVKVPRNIPNLRYFGLKTHTELPAYMKNSTVCIIPFRINTITVATNPIKMYEYLASGKPVVSTDLPEVRNVPSVYIGKDHKAFIENIRRILEGKAGFKEKETYAWLEQHTWGKRFESINAFIKEHLPAP